MNKIDEFLNKVTMYRLVVYALGGYIGLGLAYALFGKLSFSATALLVSVALLLVSAYITDRGFAKLFRVPANTESWLITGLILALMVHPATSVVSGVALLLAGAVSSASKYLITWRGKHLFNPAALAAALLSLTALQATTWWVGSSLFWPVTMVIGLAILRKIRRFTLALSFIVVAVVLQYLLFVIHHQPLAAGMKGTLLASPLIFLATIMLTEPATMPPRRREQVIFSMGIAVLYVTAWKIGPLYIYPEVALLLGNIYAFVVSPKLRVRLQLKEIQQISSQVYNYVFQPDQRFAYLPGQYMEWTLPSVPYDTRGNRRTFTFASSPTESDIHLGVKYYQPSSAYKAALAQLQIGDSIYASQLAGNFTIDPNSSDKLALIAGGIGITPFRSMVKYLLDNNIQRDIILLYVVSEADEFAYQRVFTEASKIGLRSFPIVTKPGTNTAGPIHAKLSQELLTRLIPDYAERTFFISGPDRMVDGARGYLKNLAVHENKIKTDHFSGY